MGTTKEPILELKNVKTTFKVPKGILKAVNGVDLTIYKGETVVLVGESGCGKSTLGKTIMRLYRPDEGQVMFEGQDIWRYNKKEKKEYTKNVQMIFQDPYACLDPLSVVSDIVAEGMKIHKMYKGPELEERVLELLKMVGLNKDHANRFPHEFSGGQRQRIGIARALSLEPKLIVCDEPISALDVSIQAQVINMFEDLQEQMGLTYLFIAHDLSAVKHISNRIGVMYLGRMVELADSYELITRPLHPYTKSLISAIPIADPGKARESKRIVLEGDVPSPLNPPSGCRFRTRCPYADETCATAAPEWKEIEKGHFAACHHIDKCN